MQSSHTAEKPIYAQPAEQSATENGYIYIDAPYDPEYGLTAPDEYYEF